MVFKVTIAIDGMVPAQPAGENTPPPGLRIPLPRLTLSCNIPFDQEHLRTAYTTSYFPYDDASMNLRKVGHPNSRCKAF